MVSTLLVVYWSDTVSFVQSTGHLVTPMRLAQVLRRQTYQYAGTHHAVAFGDWEGRDALAAEPLQRCGFQLRPPEEAAEIVPRLLEECRAVTLVMEPQRAVAWLGASPTAHCHLCCTGGAIPESQELPEGAWVTSLEDVLSHLTADALGLFVEWQTVAEGLRRLGVPAAPQAVAAALLRTASAVGDVAMARFYAPWHPGTTETVSLAHVDLPDWVRATIEVRYQPSGRASLAEDTLMGDLQELLERPDAPATWIIAGWHDGLPHLAHAARRQGKRVVLWTPAEWPVPEAGRIDGFTTPLTHLLDRRSLVATEAREPGVQPAREEAPVEEAPRSPQEMATPVVGSALSTWVRLLYYTDRYLREQQWPRVAFKRLAGYLATQEEFGPTPSNAMMWLNRAKAEGMLHAEHEVRRGDPPLRVTVCRSNPEHPLARPATEVPERIVRLLYQMLRKMPWVSFKLLRNVLLRDQWLGGPPHHLDEQAIDEWLNFLIQDGALRMSKEPNAENPDFPVTALRLNEEHPVVSSIVRRTEEGIRLAPERTILAIDHFLIRTQKPWMAMSTLRRGFQNLGRDELQEVLRRLQSRGALVTESYPNPQKEHATTGCYLNRDDPLVRETLALRTQIIRAVQRLQRFRTWAPLARVDEELGAGWQSRDLAIRLAWFALARDEGILELDHEGPLPLQGWGALHCRLNVAHPVVRAVVAEVPAPSEGELAAAEEETPPAVWN
ncbi:MAG: hypothetical protein HY320_00950 [Armatimonadetes bacterium]|nr:hypothetical protein [Armatimonadota bacterium]